LALKKVGTGRISKFILLSAPLGMHVILLSARLECKIYFAFGPIGVQNLFCFRPDWSAKFILLSAVAK